LMPNSANQQRSVKSSRGNSRVARWYIFRPKS
jgi:hypothetical protein